MRRALESSTGPQADLFAPRPARFGGRTFDPTLDGPRLETQLERVREVMRDQAWRSLGDVASATRARFGTRDTEAAISARLRDLRKAGFGGYTVERRRLAGGLFQYRVIPAGGRR